MCKWNTYKNIKLAYPRENSGRTIVPIDKCISNLIEIMNKHKIHTRGCCCGHNKAEGSILIDSDSYRILDSGYCEIIIPLEKK